MVDALIVHISDLHFDSRYHAKGPSVGHGGGLVGHDSAALESLETAIRRLIDRLKPKESVLVVSGDLTRVGDDSEFALALTYLRNRVRTTAKRTVGLGNLFT